MRSTEDGLREPFWRAVEKKAHNTLPQSLGWNPEKQVQPNRPTGPPVFPPGDLFTLCKPPKQAANVCKKHQLRKSSKHCIIITVWWSATPTTLGATRFPQPASLPAPSVPTIPSATAAMSTTPKRASITSNPDIMIPLLADLFVTAALRKDGNHGKTEFQMYFAYLDFGLHYRFERL